MTPRGSFRATSMGMDVQICCAMTIKVRFGGTLQTGTANSMELTGAAALAGAFTTALRF